MLRKFKLGGLVLGSLLALVGCQSEKLMNESSSQGSQMVTLTASKGKSIGSRTAISGNQTVWSEGDVIYVSSKDGSSYGYLTLEKNDANKPSGTFSGPVIGDPKSLAYSVFPAPQDGIIDLGTIEGAGKVDAPMIGKITLEEETDVYFENECGVLFIDLPQAVGLNLNISATNSNSAQLGLSAKANIKFDKISWDGDEPHLVFDANTEKNITITKSNGGAMYVPYVVTNVDEVNDLSNVTFKETTYNLEVNNASLKDSEGNLNIVGSYVSKNVKVHTYNPETQSFKPNTKAETTVTETTKTDEGVIQGTIEAPITKDQINNAVGSNPDEVVYFNVSTNVTVEQTNELTGKTENVPVEVKEVVVTLPQVASATQKAEVAVGNVADDATITIQENVDSDNETNPIQDLTVVLPSGTTKEEAENQVVINMPYTTVTVKSADGNVLKVNEVIALTGENTFIIEKGVVIENLVAMKGAIEVSGTVASLTRGEGHHYTGKTRVIVKKGGIIPDNLSKDDFEIVIENESSNSTSTGGQGFTSGGIF